MFPGFPEVEPVEVFVVITCEVIAGELPTLKATEVVESLEEDVP